MRELLLAGAVVELQELERAVWRLLRASRRWRTASDALGDDVIADRGTPEQFDELEAALAELRAADVELEQLEPDSDRRGVH